MADGKFITLEGGEGCGKTTQAHLLAEHLRRLGKSVLLTREPGGTPRAEAIREVILSGKAKKFGALAETALLYAARESHLELAIRPALAQGRWVVCDRFSDSTRAYQGAGSGVQRSVIETLEAAIVAETKPDLTFIFDCPAEIGLKRVLSRKQAKLKRAGEGERDGGAEEKEATGKGDESPSSEDRFETMGLAFHEALREAYLEIARAEPDRCVVIDATLPAEEVAQKVRTVVNKRFKLV